MPATLPRPDLTYGRGEALLVTQVKHVEVDRIVPVTMKRDVQHQPVVLFLSWGVLLGCHLTPLLPRALGKQLKGKLSQRLVHTPIRIDCRHEGIEVD